MPPYEDQDPAILVHRSIEQEFATGVDITLDDHGGRGDAGEIAGEQGRLSLKLRRRFGLSRLDSAGHGATVYQTRSGAPGGSGSFHLVILYAMIDEVPIGFDTVPRRAGGCVSQDDRPHVVIIGGGFAGLNAALTLGRFRGRVTVIDRRNYHLFLPLLYQVATAGLNPGDISAPIRWVLRRQRNTTVLLADVTRIDAQNACVVLEDETIAYDYLIIATGSSPSYFGHPEWAQYAPPLLSMEDALEVRRRLLLAWESAEREEQQAARAPWLNIVVVGGGPTGVEMAGAIAEMARHALAGDFRRFDPRQTRVLLLEGSDRVLPAYPADLSEKALQSLRRLGVEVRTGTKVTHLDEQGVRIGPERIDSRCVLWAAGAAASGIAASLGVPLDRAGRVMVAPDLSVPGHPEIFIAGDLAAAVSAGVQVPALAPAAIQEGRCAARNVIRSAAGDTTEAFHYADRGTLATIGRAAAVADFGRIKLSGLVAWLAWIFIHVYFLIGFRNRFLVMFGWAWAYLTYQRGVRLVTRYPDAAGRTGGKTLILMALALPFLMSATPGSGSQSGPTVMERRLLDLMNAERSSRGLGNLQWDGTLATLARDHAADMRSAGRISHHSTIGGGDFTYRLSRMNYRASAAAENVALDNDVERAHRGLMASPGHRANILNKELSAAGVGILLDDEGSLYVVEDFAAPVVSITDSEAQARLIAQLEVARRTSGGDPISRNSYLSRQLADYLEELIAADSVTIGHVPPYGAGWIFTYTTMDPSGIPESARGRLARAEEYALAISYRKTAAYPFGTYWVVLVLRGSA